MSTNSQPVIRLWAPAGGDPVIELLAAQLDALEQLLRGVGIGEADFMSPVPLGHYVFDEVVQYVMFTRSRLFLDSPQWCVIDAALREEDLVGTVSSFGNEADRLKHLEANGLRLVESRNG